MRQRAGGTALMRYSFTKPFCLKNLKELVLDIQWSSLCHVTQPPYLGQYSDPDSVPKRTLPPSRRFVGHSHVERSPLDSVKMKSVSPSVALAKSPGCSVVSA